MIGQYKEGTDHTQSGVGIVHNNICATAAFQYGNTALGWKLIQLSSKGPLHLKNSPLGLFPECQPSGCSNISQLWSYATFIESIVKGLFGVEPDHSGNPVIFNLHIPKDLNHASLENIQIGNDLYSIKWKKNKKNKLDIQLNCPSSDKKKRPIINVKTPDPYKTSIRYERT